MTRAHPHHESDEEPHDEPLAHLFEVAAERASPEELRRLGAAAIRIAERESQSSWSLFARSRWQRPVLAVGLAGAVAAATAFWIGQRPGPGRETGPMVTDAVVDDWVDRFVREGPGAGDLSDGVGQTAAFGLDDDDDVDPSPLAVLDLEPEGLNLLAALDLLDPALVDDGQADGWADALEQILDEPPDSEL